MHPETGQVDPAVLARRKYHESAAKWCAKWLASLHVFFGFIGLVFVLAPSMFKSWRGIVESLPVISLIFQQCSTLGGWFLLYIGLIVAVSQGKYWFSNYKKIRILSAEDRIEQYVSYEDIVNNKIYPNTKREECDFLFRVICSIILIPFAMCSFGPLSFIIRSGGYA